MKRQDPRGIGAKLKEERAAQGVPLLPENVEYEAERAKVVATKKDRQRTQAQKRKRDAELKQRGIDPAHHLSPEMLDIDERASKALGIPSVREQQQAERDACSALEAAPKK